MKPPCIHCGQPLLEYRGSWFGPGDDSYCPNGKTRHEPAPAVDPRDDTIAKLREDKTTLARVLDETVGDVKALRAELIKARKDCAHLQEALDDSEHKCICAYRLPSEHTMTEALADAVTRAVAAEGEAALLRAALAKRDATISVLRETIAALSERGATIAELRAKDRASIVAFLAAEAGRFDRSARSASGDFVYDKRALEISCDKLRAQADIIRSLAAQIERGDDRNGADTALVKPAITGRLVTVGQITTCDNDCADSGDYNFTTMSGALIVMDDDSVRAAAGLFGKVIEIRGVG